MSKPSGLLSRVIPVSTAFSLARCSVALRAAARTGLVTTLTTCAVWFAGYAYALDESTGPLGIHVYDSAGLPITVDDFPYTGVGMLVGQVENFRPGDPTPGPLSAPPDSPAFTHTNVDPFLVFETALGGGVSGTGIFVVKPDRAIDSHPERVAGVMVSTHGLLKGVAPDALLHSYAFTNSDGASRSSGEIANGAGGVNTASDPQVHIYAARSTQSIVAGNSPGFRTIPVNLSFGLQPTSGFSFTHFLDWSASTHNALYITAAGNLGQAGLTVPANQFNGLTVGATCNGPIVGTSCESTPGMPYNRISPLSLAPVDATGRRLVDLVAPGESITTPSIGGGFATSTGTSFAAPHATGTVALLQQFAQFSIGLSTPGFGVNAYQHEVMKAALMNSADKRQDTGNGMLLGMEKTVLRSNGQDWIDRRATESGRNAVPLDSELGTGALNARRAFQQFIPGEHNPGTVPNIGWDYQNTITPDSTAVYSFEQALLAGSHVALTLAWDRIVVNGEELSNPGFFDAEIYHDVGLPEFVGGAGADNLVFDTIEDDPVFGDVTEPFIDVNGNGTYDHGLAETLTPGGLKNLDLYLMPAGATGLGDAIAVSNSLLYSEEHIFAQVPTTGLYSIWLRHVGQFEGETGQYYGLAWWTLAVPEPSAYVLLLLGLAALAARTWASRSAARTTRGAGLRPAGAAGRNAKCMFFLLPPASIPSPLASRLTAVLPYTPAGPHDRGARPEMYSVHRDAMRNQG